MELVSEPTIVSCSSNRSELPEWTDSQHDSLINVHWECEETVAKVHCTYRGYADDVFFTYQFPLKVNKTSKYDISTPRILLLRHSKKNENPVKTILKLVQVINFTGDEPIFISHDQCNEVERSHVNSGKKGLCILS